MKVLHLAIELDHETIVSDLLTLADLIISDIKILGDKANGGGHIVNGQNVRDFDYEIEYIEHVSLSKSNRN